MLPACWGSRLKRDRPLRISYTDTASWSSPLPPSSTTVCLQDSSWSAAPPKRDSTWPRVSKNRFLKQAFKEGSLLLASSLLVDNFYSFSASVSSSLFLFDSDA